MTKVRAAVFASGTGSNFQAIMEAHDDLHCEIVLLVCDQPGAIVLEKARKFGVPTFIFDPKAYDSKEAYEQEIVDELQISGVSWIFLAGYMRLVGKTLLQAFEGRTINIHPSLLPAFPGIDAIGQAFDAGVKTTGVTVHYIDEGIDTGPIIAQESLEVLPEDTRETLQKRIQKIEHKLYPEVIKKLIES
jgi:phosphoribosylglycinamide formyltransferase-1